MYVKTGETKRAFWNRYYQESLEENQYMLYEYDEYLHVGHDHIAAIARETADKMLAEALAKKHPPFLS